MTNIRKKQEVDFNAEEMSDIASYFDEDDPIFLSIKKQIDDAEKALSEGLLETKLQETEGNLERVMFDLNNQKLKIEEFEVYLKSKDDLVSSLTLERDLLEFDRQALKREVESLQSGNCVVPQVFQHKQAIRTRQPDSNVCVHSIKIDENEVIAYESLVSPPRHSPSDSVDTNDEGTEIILVEADYHNPVQKGGKAGKKYSVQGNSRAAIKFFKKIPCIICFNSSQSCKVLFKPYRSKSNKMKKALFQNRRVKRCKYYPVQDIDFIAGCSKHDSVHYLGGLLTQFRQGMHSHEWLMNKLCMFEEANRTRLDELYQEMNLQNLRIAGLQRELQNVSVMSSTCPSIIRSDSFSSTTSSESKSLESEWLENDLC